MDTYNKIKRHSFQPGAMSIIQMGEELIGHPSTAINELVKNSYDADAIECKVYFHYSRKERKSFAIIYDNGNGMDDNILFGDWLKPSVSSKRKTDAKSSVFNRHLLGSKGIGRLAAMAIGEYVTVVTRENKRRLFNWITVNRAAFKEEKLLAEIDFPGDQSSDYISLFKEDVLIKERNAFKNDDLVHFLKLAELDNFKKGTLIIIEQLDESVLKILDEDFNQTESLSPQTEPFKNTHFYKSLATLITPLRLNNEIQNELLAKEIIDAKKIISNEESNFIVEFGTNLIPDQNASDIEWLPVESIPIQSVFDYRVFGKVTKKGNVRAFLSYQRLENDSYEEKFNISHTVIQEEILKKQENTLFEIDKKNEAGEYYFDISVYDIGENDNLEKLAREAGLNKTKLFKDAFKNFQGLRISKNGFGVKPYGEEVEDWVGLSKARVQQPGKNVNTNQIIGYVFFYSPENNALEEKTNREGFLENVAFIQVKNTLKSIFKELGQRRYNYRLLHGLGRVPSSKHERPDFKEYLNNLNNFKASPQLISYSEKFMKEVTTSMDNIEESLSFSERLASLGSGIELVYHEMAQPISGLRTTKSSLDLKKQKIDPEVRDIYISDLNSLHHTTDVLAELRKSLQPAIGRTRKKKFFPYNTFLKVCNLYKSDLEEFDIEIKADNRLSKLSIIEIEYAFWISFLNIINNGVYWLKKAGKGGEIRFFMEGDHFIVSNTGPFIQENYLEHIFKYGVTTRSEKNATGLGLAFTQSILSRNGWNIEAQNRHYGPAFIIKKESNE